MLDEVGLSGAVGFGVGEELADDIELVVAGEVEGFLGEGGAIAAGEDDKVFDDVGEAGAGEEVFPEVGGAVSGGVGGIAFAEVVAFVEGEEVGVGFVEFGGHPDFVGVYGEVDDAAGELEEGFAGISIGFVLFFGVVDGLVGPGIFEFEGDDRDAV